MKVWKCKLTTQLFPLIQAISAVLFSITLPDHWDTDPVRAPEVPTKYNSLMREQWRPALTCHRLSSLRSSFSRQTRQRSQPRRHRASGEEHRDRQNISAEICRSSQLLARHWGELQHLPGRLNILS